MATESEIINHFEQNFGPVDAKVIREIVSQEPEVDIRLARCGNVDEGIVLFTTGMSTAPLNYSNDGPEFQFAEAFIQLPSDWQLNEPDQQWPIEWIWRIARFPHRQNISIGHVAVLGNEDETKTFSANGKFTGMLVLAENSVKVADGIVQMYRLTPLYWSEMQLEASKGIAALLNAMDDAEMGFVVDIHRQPVVTG